MPPDSNIDPLLLQNDEQIELLKELTSTQEQQLVQGDEISTTLSEIATDAEYALLQRDEIKGALEDVVKAVKNIPKVEIPEAKEPLEEVSVKNFPDVQRVEITNHPAEKDDTKQVELLEGILEEVKKKEQYTYDIEVDSNLKEQLRGEQGVPGKDGVEITPEEVRDKLAGLEGEERLDASAIKNLDSYVKETSSHKGWTRGVKTDTGGATSNITETSKTLTFNLDGSLNSCTDSVGSETIVYTVGIPSSVVGTGVYVNKTLTYTDTLDTITL